MDLATRKSIELLLEIAEERQIHESEKPDAEFAARIRAAIDRVRTLIATLGDAAS